MGFLLTRKTEVWEGPKLNLDFCLKILGIQQANYVLQMSPFLCSFIKENHLNGVQLWRDAGRSVQVIDDVISQKGGSVNTLDLVPLIHKLRVIKSKSEQELMRRSCAIIAQAGIETMKVRASLKNNMRNNLLHLFQVRYQNQWCANPSCGLVSNTTVE